MIPDWQERARQRYIGDHFSGLVRVLKNHGLTREERSAFMIFNGEHVQAELTAVDAAGSIAAEVVVFVDKSKAYESQYDALLKALRDYQCPDDRGC